MRTPRWPLVLFIPALAGTGCVTSEVLPQAAPSVPSPDPTPLWEHAPSARLPSAVEIEHARRLGNAELFDRPPPSDRDKVIQSLSLLPLMPELPQIPRWGGSFHTSPLPTERMAAILAVPEHPKLLVELASDPSSPVRSHAAAVAAFLHIEAVVPALLSMLDAVIPPRPAREGVAPGERSSSAKIRVHRYAEAVAAWRVAVVGLASFDRRELFPRLAAILFDPPSWFTPPGQLDLKHDRAEVDQAREAVYRMLVRGGIPADWESLLVFEAQALPRTAGLGIQARGDDAAVAAAVVRYFAGIEPHRRSSAALTRIDQIAIRGERARVRLDVGRGTAHELLRVSLRRQDGIWRVDDYWPCGDTDHADALTRPRN